MHTEPNPKSLHEKAVSNLSGPSSQSRRREARHRFLSVSDAAMILGISHPRLYRAIRDRQFPALTIRGRYVVPAKVLDARQDAAPSRDATLEATNWVDGNRSA